MNSETLIKIDNVHKSYAGGFQALKGVNLEIKRGEILALLGPNGAGKTKLINAICGVVIPTSGKITVDGHDVVKDFRHTRSLIGLVPQELQLEAFEQVFQNVSYTRGLYGKRKNPAIIEKILKDLSLWDKKDSRLRELSGGMKRPIFPDSVAKNTVSLNFYLIQIQCVHIFELSIFHIVGLVWKKPCTRRAFYFSLTNIHFLLFRFNPNSYYLFISTNL